MEKDLVSKIKELKEEKNAIILAHNYQIDEVQEIADYTGDSLGLSRQAAEVEEDVIVFGGVDFMAESAAILSPDKIVLLPERNASCPMAEMVSVKELRKMKEKYPEASVVCYVNSSAAIKAESDVCCTSSNAVEIVEKVESEQIIFIPDQNLGDYVAQRTDKEIILWEGYCPTHHRVQLKDVKRAKELHPQGVVMVHPECRPEVVEAADFVGSTAQMTDYARASKADTIIVGTEMGLLYKLQEQSPNKKFYILNQGLICQNMKMTSLSEIVLALQEMQYEVNVTEDIREKAKLALDKMLELSS